MAKMSSASTRFGKFVDVFPIPFLSARAPATSDTSFEIGQVWIDSLTSQVYALASLSGGAASWTVLGPGDSDVDTLTGDSGGAISPAAGTITMAGGTNITSAGAGSTITFNLDAAITVATSVTSAAIVGSASVTSGGNIIMSAVATQLEMNGGAVTDFIGQGTLVAGTVTIANTNIAAGDRIFVTRSALNASPALGNFITTISAATSFTVASYDATGSVETTDVSAFDYFIVRQN